MSGDPSQVNNWRPIGEIVAELIQRRAQQNSGDILRSGDGRRKTDINGKPVYADVRRWRDRELSDRFNQAVVALVRQAHPDDLAD